jgi:hypothetical protein
VLLCTGEDTKMNELLANVPAAVYTGIILSAVGAWCLWYFGADTLFGPRWQQYVESEDDSIVTADDMEARVHVAESAQGGEENDVL